MQSVGESPTSPDAESTGHCSHCSEVCSVHEYEHALDKYLERLVNLHFEWLEWYADGFVQTMDFIPETVDEVYHSNMYCLSWFYEGAYPFENFDEEYENWLAEEVLQRMAAPVS